MVEQDPEALEAEAAALLERAAQLKKDAALARVKRDEDVVHVRAPTKPAFAAVRDDRKFLGACMAVEQFRGEFSAVELALALGISDRNRAQTYCRAMVEMEKLWELSDGRYRVLNDDEDMLRDYVIATGVGTVEEAAETTNVSLQEADDVLGRFFARGMIVFDDAGRWVYVEPDGANGSRERRRPPENDPPCFSEAVSRGMPIRLMDHGKRAKLGSLPGQRHKLKMRDKRYEEIQKARDDAAEAARAKMTREMDKRARRK